MSQSDLIILAERVPYVVLILYMLYQAATLAAAAIEAQARVILRLIEKIPDQNLDRNLD